MFRAVWGWALEGRRHRIPWCCGLRFGFDNARPKPLGGVPMVRRLRKVLDYRRSFAGFDGQGYVPCELHLTWWVLTGRRPEILQD